jgi:hypothetical protein
MDRRVFIKMPVLALTSSLIAGADKQEYERPTKKQMSKLGNNIPGDQEHLLKDLWHTHGMEVVGPPLKF